MKNKFWYRKKHEVSKNVNRLNECYESGKQYRKHEELNRRYGLALLNIHGRPT